MVCEENKNVYCQKHADEHSASCSKGCMEYDLYRKVKPESKEEMINDLLLKIEKTTYEKKVFLASFVKLLGYLNKFFEESLINMNKYQNFCKKQIKAIKTKSKSIVFYSLNQFGTSVCKPEQLKLEITEFCRTKLFNLEIKNIDLKYFLKRSFSNYLPVTYKTLKQVRFTELFKYKNFNAKPTMPINFFGRHFNSQLEKENMFEDIDSKLIHFEKDLYSNIFNDHQINSLLCYARYKTEPILIKRYQPISLSADFSIAFNEDDILRKLYLKRDSNCCFIKYYGFYTDDNSFNLVMDFYETDLKNILAQPIDKQKFDENFFKVMIGKLLDSYSIMSTLGIVHNDIKLKNILVGKHWELGLIGFCNSISNYNNKKLSLLLQGDINYMAPELKWAVERKLKYLKYDPEKSDVFSLGLVFLSLLLLEDISRYNKLKSRNSIFVLIEKIEIEWAKDLLRAMLVADPERRPNFSQLLAFMPIARSGTPTQ